MFDTSHITPHTSGVPVDGQNSKASVESEIELTAGVRAEAQDDKEDNDDSSSFGTYQ